MGAILTTLVQGIWQVGKWIGNFAEWFYLSCIPYVLNYLGIPLFLLGVLNE